METTMKDLNKAWDDHLSNFSDDFDGDIKLTAD